MIRGFEVSEDTRVSYKVIRSAASREMSGQPEHPLQPLIDQYPDILRSYDACRAVTYQASPLYLIPRIQRGSAWLEDCGGYLRCRSTTSDTAMVLPVHLASPQEYMTALLDTIHSVGGVYCVSLPYMNSLKRLGYTVYKRPWGSLDFVFSTETLATLPGSRYARSRTYINRLERNGLTTRLLTEADAPEARLVSDAWERAHDGRTGRMGYAADMVAQLTALPATMQVKALGLWYEDRLVGFTVAAMVTQTYWSCGFRYADNGYHGASMKLFRDTARLYEGVPYECDGDAGTKNSAAYEFKRRLVQEDLLPLQQEMFVVKR